MSCVPVGLAGKLAVAQAPEVDGRLATNKGVAVRVLERTDIEIAAVDL